MLDEYFNAKTFGSYIDGEFVQKNAHPYKQYSYALNKEWITLYHADDAEVSQALKAAERAKAAMKALTAYERSSILEEIAELLADYRDEFAELMMKEMGKNFREARGEVDYAAGYFKWFAEEAKRIYGKQIPSHVKGKQCFVSYEPIGPVAIITPWNFPLAMAARKIAPALAAGCPVICKPSSETPVSMLVLAALISKTSLPKGAFNVLIGPEEPIGNALTASPIIRKLTFTGSCPVGALLYKQSADTYKKLTMELGGHAPLIVFDDANLEQAVDGTLAAKFRNNGQTCVCANRIFVHESIHTPFLKRFIEKVKALKVGSPFEKDSDLTNVLHPMSIEKVTRHIADALEHGAKRHLNATHPYKPEILSGVTQKMLIFSEETFGPVAPIISFKSDDEVIRLANQTPYGLAAYFFTQSLKRAKTISEQLEYGVIGLNDGAPSAPQIPFGGIKSSGFGREGGPTGIYEYLVEKLVSMKL